MNKPVVVSTTMPKQKTIGYPKNTEPKVPWARALIQKVIPKKGKATTTKTFVTTAQIHNYGSLTKHTKAQQPEVSKIETQVNEVVDEILLQVTNQNDDFEELKN